MPDRVPVDYGGTNGTHNSFAVDSNGVLELSRLRKTARTLGIKSNAECKRKLDDDTDDFFISTQICTLHEAENATGDMLAVKSYFGGNFD